MDNLSTMVPWLLTIGAALVGIWQFTQQKAEANKRPFLEKQLALCFEASDAAGRLATEPDPVEWEKHRRTFWRLYWGTLCVVEDQKVEDAMVVLGDLVRAESNNPTLPMKSLEDPSYALAHAVRDLILKSWNVDLPPLENKRKE